MRSVDHGVPLVLQTGFGAIVGFEEGVAASHEPVVHDLPVDRSVHQADAAFEFRAADLVVPDLDVREPLQQDRLRSTDAADVPDEVNPVGLVGLHRSRDQALLSYSGAPVTGDRDVRCGWCAERGSVPRAPDAAASRLNMVWIWL